MLTCKHNYKNDYQYNGRKYYFKHCPVCSSVQISVYTKRKFFIKNTYIYCRKCGKEILVKKCN